jgi:hypothetical protein
MAKAEWPVRLRGEKEWPKPPPEVASHRYNFDPDLSVNHPTNKKAAEQRGLQYDSIEEVYRDEDGCMILDSFGQPLG